MIGYPLRGSIRHRSLTDAADNVRRRQAVKVFCRFGTIVVKRLLSSAGLDGQEPGLESLYEAFEAKLQSIARLSQREGSLGGLRILRKVVRDLREERVVTTGCCTMYAMTC